MGAIVLVTAYRRARGGAGAMRRGRRQVDRRQASRRGQAVRARQQVLCRKDDATKGRPYTMSAAQRSFSPLCPCPGPLLFRRMRVDRSTSVQSPSTGATAVRARMALRLEPFGECRVTAGSSARRPCQHAARHATTRRSTARPINTQLVYPVSTDHRQTTQPPEMCICMC